MRAKVTSRALGDHFLGKVYPVANMLRVNGKTVYELDTTPAQWWRETKLCPFLADEVTILVEAS